MKGRGGIPPSARRKRGPPPTGSLQREEIQEDENQGDDLKKRKLPIRNARRGIRITGTGNDVVSAYKEESVSMSDSEESCGFSSSDESSESESLVSHDSELSSDDNRRRKRQRLPATRQPTGRGRGGRRDRARTGSILEPKRSRSKKRIPKVLLEWELFTQAWENTWGGMEDEEIEAINKQKNGPVQMNPPLELQMPLLPFQKEWLAWSLKQEASEIKGGILADEMGMGKTIQAISLIMTDRHLNGPMDSTRQAPVHRPKRAVEGAEILEEPPQVKATLVICPMVAVIQWRSEIEKFTAPGSVKVLIYHGPKRGLGIDELSTYDIVLSTYAIVEGEHRRHVMPPKVPCSSCSKTFYPDRLAVHLRFFCGPLAQRTLKQAKQVKRNMPARVASKLLDEDSPEDLKTGKSKREKGTKDIRNRKIDSNDLKGALQGTKSCGAASSSRTSTGNSVLHSVKWGRIILDEAHSIKDRRSSTAKAIFALKSTYKWALSGTPLQNRVGELYSLVRFLAVDPFSYYFCRNCNCKSLDYMFSAGTKCECGHSPLHHFCWWNKFIANPIKKWGYVHDGRKAMRLLKHLVLNDTLLRRTKLERAADLALPPRTMYLRRDVFDPKEEDYYQSLYSQSQSQFNTYVDAGTLLNNYAHIFDLLTRLRQAVNHPYLVIYSATVRDAPRFDAVIEEVVCGICHETAEDAVETGCHHSFCRLCIQDYIETGKEVDVLQCPSCPTPLMVDLATTEVAPKIAGRKRSSILNRINLDKFHSSTKTDAVREEIFNMLEKDPSAKAIIFSQFTAMLELIGFCLQKSGIRFVKLDGSMSMQARDHMIENFTNDAEIKVFLMSLKAGGVALNLTVASHVFLMDPWWNPAVEQQAQDRIHRLGQYKPVRVVRFVIENTIEERILKLQEKKQLVFEGTIGGSTEALGRLTEDDLRFLFTN